MWKADPRKLVVPSSAEALPGRSRPLSVSPVHAVSGAPTVPPFPAGSETALFALGCIRGAERLFCGAPGVISTQVGYAGGTTPNRPARRSAPA